jgi:Uma2 family endonuclease
MMDAMSTPTRLMTFAEFEQLPDEPNKLELIDGELIRMPPVQTNHMRISQRLFKMLDAVLQQLHSQGQALDLGEVFIETGYHIGDNWLIPDVSITHAGQAENKYLEGAPALAIEVMSRRNTAEMMQRKVRIYLDNGAREVWLLYRRPATVAVYRGRTSVEIEAILTSELLPGISIDLAEVFRRPEGTRS